MNEFKLTSFIIAQVQAIFVLLFCMNFISENNSLLYFGNIINFTLTFIGELIIQQKQPFSIELTIYLIKNNVGFGVTTYISFAVYIWIVIQLFKKEKK